MLLTSPWRQVEMWLVAAFYFTEKKRSDFTMRKGIRLFFTLEYRLHSKAFFVQDFMLPPLPWRPR